MSSSQRIEVVSPEQIRVLPRVDLEEELFVLGMWGQGDIEFGPLDTFASVASCLYARKTEPKRVVAGAYLADVTDAAVPIDGFSNKYFAEITTADNYSGEHDEKNHAAIERDMGVFCSVNPRVFYVSAVAVTAQGLRAISDSEGNFGQKHELAKYASDWVMKGLGQHVLLVTGERNCLRIFGGGRIYGISEDDGRSHRLVTSFDHR